MQITGMQNSPFELATQDAHIIRGAHWTGDGDIAAIIQIFHGLGEHHGRYERFAKLATANGYAVVAHDHRGHGAHAARLGHLSDKNGWRLLVDDGLQVNDMIGDLYPGAPTIAELGCNRAREALVVFDDQQRLSRLAHAAASAETEARGIEMRATAPPSSRSSRYSSAPTACERLYT